MQSQPFQAGHEGSIPFARSFARSNLNPRSEPRLALSPSVITKPVSGRVPDRKFPEACCAARQSAAHRRCNRLTPVPVRGVDLRS